jgi:Skp family chaperone for outer membrane proteins
MNRKFVLLTALVAGLPLAAGAQASPAVPQSAQSAPAAAAPEVPPAPVAPSAYPAKIALIALNQAVIATNEGQQAMQEVQKKYEPKKAQIDAQAAEVDALKKQLQAAPATLPEDERASRLKTIDTKDKALQRDVEDAQTSYQSDLQEAYGKVAQKFYPVLLKYVEDNGYTLLLNVSDSEQAPTPIMWTKHDPNADITEAVIAVYNSVSKVAAPAPSAPSASRPRPSTTPHTTAPHTTTPKPPSQ